MTGQVVLMALARKWGSEQAPGSVFHPRGENEKNNCDLFWPSWCHIKVDPET